MPRVNQQTTGSQPRADNVCAVIVTYHPLPDLRERVACTAEQVDRVIIIDNDSGPSAAVMLRDISARDNVDLVCNVRNFGLAAALNQGARRALAQGYSWILVLDQDSMPEPKMVDALRAAYVSNPRSDTIGVIAPLVVDQLSGYAELAQLCNDKESVEVTTALTSGSLIAAPLFTSAGPFREDFFIDYVDVEHCLRLRRHGYSIIVACKAKLLHNLGAPTYHRFLWKPRVVTSNHSPLRRYYITRNRILVMKEYALREPAWTVGELRALCKEAAKMLLFEGDKREKSRFFLRGLVDALLDRTGEFPGRRLRRGSGKVTSDRD